MNIVSFLFSWFVLSTFDGIGWFILATVAKSNVSRASQAAKMNRLSIIVSDDYLLLTQVVATERW